MRLQRIEIKGFKSFANQTVINFNEDVIGIVGSNGSGKSNIVDAIRWVLGEQKSRELRLDQMSSVIFNGTRKRKAGGMAQVALTFENTRNLLPTEYQEVTITRILYRNGDSEYRLNGVPCRLKDITSLFLDTGIGSNSYAIIALGMIDDILNDKDNARRRMFEQAAGISKYKVRKRETINKLRNTTEDLERVEDLLFEISSNLQALEKQAKRTKRYFELKKQYKELSVELALLCMTDLKHSHDELSARIRQEEDRFRGLETEIANLEAQLEQKRKTHLDKEKLLSERQRQLNQLVGEIRNREGERRMLEQKLEFVEQNRQKLHLEVEQAQRRIRELEADITSYRSDVNLEKRIEARLEVELNDAEAELEKISQSHYNLKAELDGVVAEQQLAERVVIELEKQKAVDSNRVQSLEQELQRSEQEIAIRLESIANLERERTEMDERIATKSYRLEQLEQAEGRRKGAMEKAETELELTNQEIATVNRELDAKRNEYKLTKSMIENLEGFPESIRFLNNNKEWNQTAPLLSDLIYVQEDYRVAIENFLGPYLNYYVVENKAEAIQAIRLLGRSQKGKANFFLLDAFEDYNPPIALLPDTTQAIDLVETDPAYRKLCSYLLENVLVTEEEDLEVSLPEGDVVLLSRSGRFIKRRYSLSGGSIGLFEGKKIGRKKNLEILDTAIRQAEKRQNALSTAFFNIKKKLEGLKAANTPAEIQHEKNELNALLQAKVSLDTRLENFQSFINEVNTKQEKLQTEIEALQSGIQRVDQQLADQQKDLTHIRDRITNTDGHYQQVAEQMSTVSTAFNEKNIQFIRQQNKVTTLQQELTFREEQLQELRTSLDDNQNTIDRSRQEASQIQEKLYALAQQLQTSYQERDERTATLSEAEQVYFQTRGTINDIEDQLRKVNKQRSDNQLVINQLKDKINEVKVQISSIAQQLRIEFQIDINELLQQEPKTDLGIEDLEGKVAKLKNRLDHYGEINPMAVEAYDEIKERHDTITRQRDDILEAKSSLEATIQEIEETATQQFLAAFDKVRLYFINVFRSLFTEEDDCDLVLLEPQSPLESKIEIVARPKGKRPQTINQLSGGEKTLTATALLFALYLLKPAPFCIFDEVDAPLDDANIYKFNKIIKKFSEDSQFIIVTHNKLTMAAVDVIYGVHMAEEGVSGVMPVDFRDLDHEGVSDSVATAPR